MRYLKFAGKFILACLAVGLVLNLTMYYCVVRPQAREELAGRIPPVRLENVELGPALQQLAQSTHPALHLSMCPDVAARRVSITTTAEMPLEDFVQLLAGKTGAERSNCGVRSFVYVRARAAAP